MTLEKKNQIHHYVVKVWKTYINMSFILIINHVVLGNYLYRLLPYNSCIQIETNKIPLPNDLSVMHKCNYKSFVTNAVAIHMYIGNHYE